MRVLFFDTETTDKIYRKEPMTPEAQPARLVQLAALLQEGERRVGEFVALVEPSGEWHMTQEAEATHGISEEDCRNYGIPLVNVLSVFSRLVKNSDEVVAHNIAFDRAVIALELARLGRPNRLDQARQFCTMLATTEVCRIPKPQKWQRPGDLYKWPTLAEAHQTLLGSTFEGAHDAMVDVEACARIYYALKAEGLYPGRETSSKGPGEQALIPG